MKRAARYQAKQNAKLPTGYEVFMLFELQRATWTVTFTRPLGAGTLPRILKFSDPAKVASLYERFGSNRLSEDRVAFESAIQRGRGVVLLCLGREQYEKLLSKGPRL